MVWVIGLVVAVAVAAGVVYLGRERLGLQGAGLAALRTVGLGALLLLIANPGVLRPGSRGLATVLLDASFSMGTAGGPWQRALDTARALAGPDGTILRFGDRVDPFDSTPPTMANTLLEPALRTAAGRGGPVWVVTDGEVRDGQALPPGLERAAGFVVLPRDTMPDAALLAVGVEDRLLPTDSVRVRVEIGTWGVLPDSTGELEIAAGDRMLLRRTLTLPRSPGLARRTVRLPAGALGPGTHVLTIRLRAAGDREPGNDTRMRVVTVAAMPAVVAIVAPADWEGRFLVATLAAVTDASVQGYARLAGDRWVDMRTQQAVDPGTVRRAAASADLLVLRGDPPFSPPRPRPTWYWPAGTGAGRIMAGDWYPAGPPPASPLGGRLGPVAWDSLPPLTGIVPITPAASEWSALTARAGRRGAERPVLVGGDSAGVRRLVTTGTGLWRWALRGGGPHEAYRTFVAAGADWLLGSGVLRTRDRLAVTPVVERGAPVVFRWTGAEPPPALPVALDGVDTALQDTLIFDAGGTARRRLPPGVYRWRAAGGAGAGVFVVESYAAEYAPGPVTVGATEPRGTMAFLLVGVRDRWWLFVLVIAALVGEWAWRIRRGLP